MASVKLNDCGLPIFDGIDYSNWKIRILKFLEYKKCLEVAIRNKETKDNEANWKEMDIKATNFIYTAITNKQLEYVSELNTSFEIMCKFDEMYLKKSTALQIICRNTLENIKLKNYSDVNLFFDDFEKCVNELKQAGATVSEQEKLNYMLRSLPSEYSYIGDLIDVLPAEDRTVDYLKSKIKMKMIEKNNCDTSCDKTNVFKAQSSTSSFQNKLKCFGCGKIGHIQRNCRFKKENYSQGRGFVNYRGQGARRYNNRSFRGSRGNNHSTQNYEKEDGNSFYSTIVNNTTIPVMENDSVKECQINWLLDSGCTDHIINTDQYFNQNTTLDEPINVKVGDGRVLKATKVGDIITYFIVYGNRCKVTLKNVFYVKDMKANLLSYSKITENHSIVSVGNISKIYNSNNKIIALATKDDRLYKMTSFASKNEVCANVIKLSLKEKLHRTLGHVNFNYLNIMCKNELLEGIPTEIESDYMKCEICIENKMHNLPFNNNRRRAKDILEIIHTDLNGPHRTAGPKGEKFFISFIDDYSKLSKVYCISSKDQVYECFVEYTNEVTNLTGKTIKEIRCDNGKEYMNSKFYDFARKKGILIKACPAYVHELNGTAERFNRSIMDMARCLLTEAKVDRCFWPEVIKTAAYLKNRTLTNTIERKTPYEIFFKRKPSIKNLRLYGSKVFVRIPEVKRQSKWDKKAEQGILLGYTDVGYRILINNKVIVARHVDIIEEDIHCIGYGDEMEEENVTSEDLDLNNASESTSETTNEEQIARRSQRQIKPPVRFDDEFNYYCICVNYSDAMIPDSFQEAIASEEADNWREAMNKEMESLVTNDTWTLVRRPVDEKILDVKWVYRKKSEDKFKARLVVKGFQQVNLIDDTYSPVIKMQTLKLLLSYCCQYSLNIHQMDVETAFLNGKVLSNVYVKQPQGYEDGTDKVYKLKKSLYGLKESPRAWYDCFNDFIISLDFRRSKFDYCLYFKRKDNKPVYILLFVDDLLICCEDMNLINEVKNKLSYKFKMKDMGKVKNYVGIDIMYNYANRIMTLSQEKYIESLAKRYRIENSKLYKTPMEINLKLQKSECENVNVNYRNLLGALLYISSGTRPDISFSVNYLSRFQNCYDKNHYKYALRVLKYLYLTKNLKLTYRQNPNTDEIMDCYVDSDWAGDINDRKSTTGFVVRLFGNVIFWKTRKQNSVTKSSTFAEYIALSEAVTEIKFLRCLYEDLFYELRKPTRIFEDNSGALAIAKYGNFTKNSKHIEVHYHFVHESVKDGIIIIDKIDSDNNVADIFTKALGKEKFVKFTEMLNLIE